MLDNLVKYISLFSIGAFLAGYAYQYAYYLQFGIDILLYSNNIEFFYQLLPLVIFILLIVLLISLLVWFAPSSNLSPITFKKKVLLTIILTSILAFSGYYKNKNYVFEAHSEVIFFSNLAVCVLAYLLLIYPTKISEFKLKHISILYLILIFLIADYAMAKGKQVKKFGNTVQYQVSKGGNSFKTSEHYFLIGETQLYLFFFNNKDSLTTIIKRSDIDTLKIKGLK